MNITQVQLTTDIIQYYGTEQIRPVKECVKCKNVECKLQTGRAQEKLYDQISEWLDLGQSKTKRSIGSTTINR